MFKAIVNVLACTTLSLTICRRGGRWWLLSTKALGQLVYPCEWCLTRAVAVTALRFQRHFFSIFWTFTDFGLKSCEDSGMQMGDMNLAGQIRMHCRAPA